MLEKKEIRVAFYVRVSTPEQGKSGYGLDYQLSALEDLIKYRANQDPKWITHKKWFYEDAWYTWGDLNRPAYTRMIEDARKWEFDMIAVWKIDRMSRNLSHLLRVFEELKSYKVWFYSIKENIDFSGPIWKLTFQIFWALAEFEREMIKSRTVEWKIASARQWNYVFPSAPYWYKKVRNFWWKGSKLKKIEEEAEIVKSVFHWFIYEDLSYSEIWRKLTGLGIEKWQWWIRKNIKFTKWYDTSVKDIITRSEYAWYVEWNTKKDNEEFNTTIMTPPIISESLFRLAQEKVKQIEHEKRWGKRKYLLSWKVEDLESWRKLIGVNRTKWWHSYRIKKFIRADGASISWKEFPWKALDDFVWETICSFLNKPQKFFTLYKKHSSELKKIDRYQDEILLYEWKLTQLEIERDNIERRSFTWRISDERADKFLLEVNQKENALRVKLKATEEKIEYLMNIELTEDMIGKVAVTYMKNIKSLNLDQKRRIVETLVEKICVSKGKEWDIEVDVIFRFDPDKNDHEDNEDELKDSTTIKKSTDKSALFFGYGAPCRARTYDPQVRSLVLFQLS